MTMPAIAQRSFFDPEFLCPTLLTEGSLPWLLATQPGVVVPERMRQAWERPGLPGRDPWPLRVVAGVTLLRYWEEGTSRRGAARRLSSDGAWRAAVGLSWQDRTPDESELRRFERFLCERDAETGARWSFVWLGHVVEVCARGGVLGCTGTWVIDSTPMLCHGAILDTIRFLGDEARSLAAEWAKVRGTTTSDLVKAWQQPLLLARSTKGFFRETDWSEPEERSEATIVVAQTALEVVSRIRGQLEEVQSAGKRKRLARRCRNLLRKIEEDLETDAQGRLTIARRVAEDRLVSRTDPEARHSRKSRKHCFNGFKVHVIGESVSGLIAAVCVTSANVHDGAVAHRLIGRARALRDDISQVLGDTHYGSARLRKLVRGTLAVDLLGKPQALPRRVEERVRKEDFEIDFDAMTATCPAGVTTQRWTWKYNGEERLVAPRFYWAAGTCRGCSKRAGCLGSGCKGRVVELHPYERELRELRRRWNEPETKRTYRRRTLGERLIFTMTRHGCRRARAWGLQAAQVQAASVAIASNLKLLARSFFGNGIQKDVPDS